MPETFRGTQVEIGDKVRPGEDTQVQSGVDQQRNPNDADPQQPKHGKSAEAESRSTTG